MLLNSIQWTDLRYSGCMAQTAAGAIKVAAKKVGLSEDEYKRRLSAGLKRCTKCKQWKNTSEYGIDTSRFDGQKAACRTCSRVPVKRAQRFIATAREKQRAHDAIRWAVKRGFMTAAITLKCSRCHAPAKQYHHHKGYAREHVLNVIPLCVSCHRKADLL